MPNGPGSFGPGISGFPSDPRITIFESSMEEPFPMSRKFKQCRRYNDPGHAHSLTFSCFHRRRFLLSDRLRWWLADAIARASTKHRVQIWAYVFMPEHVHLLLNPTTPEYNISAVLQTIKQSSCKRALNWLEANRPEALSQLLDVQPNGQRRYRVWQRGGGHDRNLTSPEAIHATIEYIHANPVRKALCATPEDWHWSSAADFAGRRDGPLPVDVGAVPRLLRDGR